MGFLAPPPTPVQTQQPVQPVTPAQVRDDPAVEEARRQELLALQDRGRRATLLTGGRGVTDDAPTRTRRLLGGGG